jgi:hypothetical protein
LTQQLFDIATNEEFSPDQRMSLMAIVLDDAPKTPTPMAVNVIDHALSVTQADSRRMGYTHG